MGALDTVKGGKDSKVVDPSAPTGKKKKQGILGRVGGAVLSGLSAPQQVALRAVEGINKGVQGDIGGALGSVGKGLKEAVTIGQEPGDIDLAKALAHRDKSQEGGYRDRKLPYGVNFVGSAALDPTMYVGIGEGAAAAKGVKTLALLKGETDDAIRAGLKSGAIKLTKGSADRELLEEGLKFGGSKAKEATKISKATKLRAGGGVKVSIPLTEKGVQFGQGLKPIAKTKALIEGTEKGGKLLKGLRSATNPVGKLADDLGGDTLIARQIRELGNVRGNKKWIANDETFHELKNAVSTLGRDLTGEEDALLHSVLEKGDEARVALKETHPQLGDIADTMHNMRVKVTDKQIKAGALGKVTTADDVTKARESADTLTQEAEELNKRAQGLTARAAKDARTAKSKLVKAVRAHSEGKITLDELNKQKSRVTAIEKTAKKIEEKGRKVRSEWLTKSSEAKKATKVADKTVEGISGVHDTSTYLQRLPGDKAAEAVGDTVRGGHSLKAALKQSATEFRGLFPEMPVEGINDLHKAYHIAESNGSSGYDAILNALNDPEYAKYVKGKNIEMQAKAMADVAAKVPADAEIFKQSAVSSLLSRAESANEAIAARDYVKDLKGLNKEAKNGLGVLHDEASMLDAGLTPKQLHEAGWEKFDLPELGTHYAPKEVVTEMKNIVQVIGQDDFIPNFEKAMTAWGQFWKTQATTGLLGALPFAMRNARSNVYLMMTEGMNPKQVIEYMTKAKKMENTVRDVYAGKFKDLVNKHGLDEVLKQKLGPQYNEFKQMQQDGIITSGFFHTNIKNPMGGRLKGVGVKDSKYLPAQGNRAQRGVKFVLGREGKVSQTGYKINSGIEKNARMALYMHNIDKYGDPVLAAQRTKKVLFDYGELTQFEQKVMKNVIPFYTFMRKNLPHQLQTLAENPMRITIPEKISQAVSTPLPEGAPGYQQDQGSRGVNPLIPFFGGMISTPDRPIYAAGETLSPLIHAIKGEGKEAAGAIANLPSGPAPGLLKALQEIHSGTDLFSGARVKPGAVSSAQRLVASQLPSIARLPGRVGPVTTEDLTGKSKKDKKTIAEILKFLSGIRVDQPRQS